MKKQEESKKKIHPIVKLIIATCVLIAIRNFYNFATSPYRMDNYIDGFPKDFVWGVVWIVIATIIGVFFKPEESGEPEE